MLWGDENMTERHHPLVFAHRGASGYAPENTMASFEKAVELGTDGFELDVQLTADGELVVIHDEWLERVSDGSGYVKDYTYEQLKQLNFNKNFPQYGPQQIPLLKEVLRLVKKAGIKVNIELKTGVFHYPGIVEKTLQLVEEMGLKDSVIYSSFNHQTCVDIKKIQPDAYVGFLYDDGIIDVRKYVKEHGGDAIHPAFYMLQYPEHAIEAKKLGLEINTWTVNEPAHIELACQLGVDIIITNYPDRALEIVKKHK